MKRLVLPTISFIIPTLNAEDILPKCLQAIRSQNYQQNKIEIIIADGGSSDKTKHIAKQYGAILIKNPEVLHEQGKSRAAKKASGDILFYTDADNILAHSDWLRLMVQPYIDNQQIKGFLPQTIPAPDSHMLDRYLGYLFTDPFTWFIYGNGANPRDYELIYRPVKKTTLYTIYRFPEKNFPLFGFSQGVGVTRTFKRGREAHADDILAGMKLIREGGLIAYVPQAGIYHYHIKGFLHFIYKYRWRVKNNFSQKIKGMGIKNRIIFFDKNKQRRIKLFIPYGLSIVFPIIDGFKLSLKYNDPVMLLHPLACFLLALIISYEYITFTLFNSNQVGTYK